MPPRRSIGSLVAVALLGIVAGFAVLASLHGGGTAHRGQPTRAASSVVSLAAPIGDPSLLPRPRRGEVHGRLLYLDTTCQLHVFDSSGRAASPPHAATVAGCHLWASPSGRFVAFTPGQQPAAGLPLRIADLATGRVYDPQLAVGTVTQGPPVIANDGTIAACDTAAQGVAVTFVARLGKAPRAVRGCLPAFLGNRLVVVDAQSRIVDARGRLVARRPRSAASVAALAASPDGRRLAAIASAGDGSLVADLVIPAGGPARPAQQVGIGTTVTTARLANGGADVIVQSNGGWSLVNLATGTAVTTVAGALVLDAAPSPDGHAIAVVTPAALVLLDAGTLGPVSALPVEATVVAWVS